MDTTFIEFVRQLGPWGWLVAGLVLLGLELVAPGNVLMWFGLAALVTGGVTLITDFGWQGDFLLFGILSLIFVVVGRRFFARGTVPSEQPFLNQRAGGLVGRNFVLAEPIVGGNGRIRVDDTIWRISGPDLPSGTRVRVVRTDGAVLVVEAG
jgi:membrane protein implicated in regulation of membrane protease activity